MNVVQRQWRRLAFPIVLVLAAAHWGLAAEPALSKEQMRQFLLTAKVVSSKHTGKGITDPWRLTLSDGAITHDAQFQSIDDHKMSMQFGDGTTEMNFVDSYKYNIASYELAVLVGLGDMLPVTVERSWNGKLGSLSWWLPVKMDEQDRLKKKLSSPNADAWNKQMYKIRVFDELVYDTDANLTNVLIGDDWQLWRVDFSRAFRLSKDVKSTKNLERCDRQLLDNLKSLNEADVSLKTKNFLTKLEVQGVMARRDKIVAYFQKLISEKGEAAILY